MGFINGKKVLAINNTTYMGNNINLDATPKGVYANLAALQAAYPTGSDGVYLTSDNGHWYYYQNGWQDGGVYQAVDIADGSITKSKINSDLAQNILLENKLIDKIIINKESVVTKVGIYTSIASYEPSYIDYTCVELPISNCDSLEFEALQGSGIPIVFYKKIDGTIGEIPKTAGKKHLDLKDIEKIAINFFGSDYCSDFTIIKNGISLKIDNKLIINKNNITYRDGCFLNFNDYQLYTDHQCSYIYKCNNLKSISFKAGGYGFAEIVWKDKNNNIYGSTTGTTDYITVDVSNAVEIAFNFFDKRDVSYEITFKDANETKENLNAYNHYNNKGLTFNNTKSALFVGDSITAGFTSGSTTTTNGYPKLFSDYYSMVYYNEAVGGAEYCEDGDYQGNLIPRILTQITNSTHKNVDYLFIAGGINDWQGQNNLTTFKTAVSDTIDYALNNYPNAQIILITPINACTSFNSVEKINSVQVYRNIITETAIEKNSSRLTVIQGNLINFPNTTNNQSYINTIFGDGLHPSELGYHLYANSLIDIFN